MIKDTSNVIRLFFFIPKEITDHGNKSEEYRKYKKKDRLKACILKRVRIK